ncbi:MAG: hypothetical protein IKS98_12470 [Lachnospiraceae bacterium]|nr:hypothetical protein [Lachnospiraceae bacterium]
MKPMKVFFGYLILWAICAILILISFAGSEMNVVLLTVSLAVMIAGNIAYYILYRCPHCDRALFNRVAPWHYCPYCGNHLNEDISDHTYEANDDESSKRSDGINIQ